MGVARRRLVGAARRVPVENWWVRRDASWKGCGGCGATPGKRPFVDGSRKQWFLICDRFLVPPLYTPLNETWTAIHASSLQQLQLALQQNIPPWLWDPVAVSVLNAPTFVVLGVIGAILVLLGRRKKRLIGYGR